MKKYKIGIRLIVLLLITGFCLNSGSVLAQTTPIVPITVDKKAVPVSNPQDLANPNAWDITLSIQTGNVSPQTSDIVIVFDASRSMEGKRLKEAKKAASYFVEKMLPEGVNTENVRVALVVYNKRATISSELTKDALSLKQKIDKISIDGGTHTQDGLKKARDLLSSSSADHKHIVLLSDGEARIQYVLKYKEPIDFVNEYGDDLVATLNKKSHKEYYYSRGDLDESRYDYNHHSQSSGTTIFYFDDKGKKGKKKKEYYLFPCNAAVNEARFAKKAGAKIHSIGLDLDNETATKSLKKIATTEGDYHPASPVELIKVFDNIAQTIKTGLKNGMVNDIVAPGFIIDKVSDTGDITNAVTVSQGTVAYDANKNTISWNVGEIGKSASATLTYRIYANLDEIQAGHYHINPHGIGPDLGGFDTNTDATLTYTNSNDQPNQKKSFPHPTVKLGYGIIKRHYVMVNAEGQPIQSDGTVVSSLSEAQILQPQDFFLPKEGNNIEPKWVKLDKTNDNLQNFSVTPKGVNFAYNGKLYNFTTANGSTPSGGSVGISWKQPVANAYFAYKEGFPPVVPVTVDKSAKLVENPLDPNNPNAWDVTLKVKSSAITIPVDVVMVIDQSSSMGGENIARLKSVIASGQRFVKRMLSKGKATEGVRIALVSYDHEPHKLSDFTTDTTSLCQKIRALTPIWGTHTQGGLKMARKIMATSNAVYKHIILMSDGLATEQYPIKNLSANDFIEKTGNSNDPIDLVINNSIAYPTNYVSNNPHTPLVPKYPTHNSKVGKRDLAESKYDYSDLSARVTFDGVAGALIYEQKLPSPYYYYFPCNAAINEAQFAKNEGCEIHTIGYDLGDFPLANNSLKLTATTDNHFFTATPENLDTAFDNIAQNINVGVQQGTVTDLVAPGFIVKNMTQSGDVTHLLNVSQGTVHYDISNKKLTWVTGSVLSSMEATITYRIYADLDQIQAGHGNINPDGIGPDHGGFDTNTSAILTYTNSNGEPNQQLIFPRPTVKLGYGVIKRHYVLVNKDGQPIQSNGTVVSSFSQAHVLQTQDFFLPTDGDNIAPKWIKLDKTTDELQYYSVSPNNMVITTDDGKRYHFVEVLGSTPNPGQIGISWSKPAGNAYFAYKLLNYWMGGTSGQENLWNIPTNWTGVEVPLVQEDIEFATEANFGTAAVADLYLDNVNQNNSGGRIIGNLINNSNKNLVITNSNQLTINGTVTDNNSNAGTIVIQSLPDQPSGTLLFTKPNQNQSVNATVEFYNKGYDCAECGMYRRSWQYFGIPVKSLNLFPYENVTGEETINQWQEPFNGNKWQPATFPMSAFNGYEITNSSNTEPSDVYKIEGTLVVEDATVPLTHTSGVNYIGANLVGNPYTAAIDIKNSLTFPTEAEQTVYLFNTGTRDQWRKLDGSTVSGYRAGQYLAVPQEMAGKNNFPDRIPSMHAFMLKMKSGSMANLNIAYDKLIQNKLVNNGNGTQIAWRSGVNDDTNLPFLVMDVLGNESADRLWIFSHPNMTFGFDNGWDGRKLTEKGISQLYAMSDKDNDMFQVALVPQINGLLIGFDADKEGMYNLEFALSKNYTDKAIFLQDLSSGVKQRIVDGGSYSFSAKQGDTGARFRLTYNEDGFLDKSSVLVSSTVDKRISIINNSVHNYIANVYTTDGKLLRQVSIQAGNKSMTEPLTDGAYIISLQSSTTTREVRKVVID